MFLGTRNIISKACIFAVVGLANMVCLDRALLTHPIGSFESVILPIVTMVYGYGYGYGYTMVQVVWVNASV